MPDWLTHLLVGVAGTALPFLLARFIPNQKLDLIFFNIGVRLSALARSRIGTGWERLEQHLQGSLSAIYNGLQRGLNSDDEQQNTDGPRYTDRTSG